MDFLQIVEIDRIRPRQLTLRDKQKTYVDSKLQKATVELIKKDVQQFLDQTNTLQTHYVSKRKRSLDDFFNYSSIEDKFEQQEQKVQQLVKTSLLFKKNIPSSSVNLPQNCSGDDHIQQNFENLKQYLREKEFEKMQSQVINRARRERRKSCCCRRCGIITKMQYNNQNVGQKIKMHEKRKRQKYYQLQDFITDYFEPCYQKLKYSQTPQQTRARKQSKTNTEKGDLLPLLMPEKKKEKKITQVPQGNTLIHLIHTEIDSLQAKPVATSRPKRSIFCAVDPFGQANLASRLMAKHTKTSVQNQNQSSNFETPTNALQSQQSGELLNSNQSLEDSKLASLKIDSNCMLREKEISQENQLQQSVFNQTSYQLSSSVHHNNNNSNSRFDRSLRLRVQTTVQEKHNSAANSAEKKKNLYPSMTPSVMFHKMYHFPEPYSPSNKQHPIHLSNLAQSGHLTKRNQPDTLNNLLNQFDKTNSTKKPKQRKNIQQYQFQQPVPSSLQQMNQKAMKNFQRIQQSWEGYCKAKTMAHSPRNQLNTNNTNTSSNFGSSTKDYSCSPKYASQTDRYETFQNTQSCIMSPQIDKNNKSNNSFLPKINKKSEEQVINILPKSKFLRSQQDKKQANYVRQQTSLQDNMKKDTKFSQLSTLFQAKQILNTDKPKTKFINFKTSDQSIKNKYVNQFYIKKQKTQLYNTSASRINTLQSVNNSIQ